MEDQMNDASGLNPSYVRDQLDEILAQEITALLDIDSGAAMMSFNLASISCITLIIEREREINHYSDSPPERYTHETFVNELVDIGLENDDSLKAALSAVIGKGYISQAENSELKAEMPAFMMVGFLDNMFPGMQGMNLVAFVLQMNDEVNSGRKSLELAIDSFTSTLKSRGVSVTKEKAEKKASEIISGTVVTSSQAKEISKKLKKNNLNRLSKLIKKRKKRSAGSPQMKIKDVFGKGPSKEELEAQKEEIKKAEEAAKKAAELAKQLAEKEEAIKEAEEAAKEAHRQLQEIEEREKQLAAAQEQAQKTEAMASELAAKEAEMAEREAQLKAMEERLKQQEEAKRLEEEQERLKNEEEEKKKASQADDDIESQIAAFESELAMPCPLCKEGRVESKTTEKGKEFYSCNTDACRFVSWDKPYHFECPLCKNPFLTEETLPSGVKGLKCPRAACAYNQDNLFDPKQNMAKTAAASKPKKKKKLVRRRKRR